MISSISKKVLITVLLGLIGNIITCCKPSPTDKAQSAEQEKVKRDVETNVRSLFLSGLGASADSANIIFPKLKEFLIPSVSYLSGRNEDLVRDEVRGPRIYPTSSVQGECLFDNSSLNCEIRLHEGLFLSLRCITEILATQMAMPRNKASMLDVLTGKTESSIRQSESLPRSKAVELLEAVLERFWLRPDDPLGAPDLFDKERRFRPDYVRPIIDVLASLQGGLEDPERYEWSQMMVLSSSLFIMAHELGHYVTKAKLDEAELESWAAAIPKTGMIPPESPDDDWTRNWAVEFIADWQANLILLDFWQKLAKNEVKGIEFNGDPKTLLLRALMESYSGIFLALGCVHLLETYGWARFGNPYPSADHPPAFRRREFLVRTIPPQAVVISTWYAEWLLSHLETLFSDVLSQQDKKKRLNIKGSVKTETLEYFASARKRFLENYAEGKIADEVRQLHEQLKWKW